MSFPRHGMLLLATLAGVFMMRPTRAQTETTPTGSGGGAPSGSQQLIFAAQLAAQASYRQDLNLAPDGDPGRSTRLIAGMVWTLRSPTTSLYASLSPYLEYFATDSSYSTYGGSAGLGFQQRRGPKWSWGLRARFQAAPEQDVPPPQTSESLDPPEVGRLVPRNGYLYGTVDLAASSELTARSNLGITGSLAARRYNIYQVQDDEGEEVFLADSRSYGLAASWRVNTSSLNTWSLNLSANQNQLNDPTRVDEPEERPQAGANIGYSRHLTQRQNLNLASGFSTIDTGDSVGVSTPTLLVGWTYAGRTWGASMSIQRNQGIFPGSLTAVDASSVAARWAWQHRIHSFGMTAGYGLSVDAREGRDARTGTTNQILGANYSRGGRLLSWGGGLFYNRQVSDADFGGNLETARIFVSLGWQIAGRPSSGAGGAS